MQCVAAKRIEGSCVADLYKFLSSSVSALPLIIVLSVALGACQSPTSSGSQNDTPKDRRIDPDPDPVLVPGTEDAAYNLLLRRLEVNLDERGVYKENSPPPVFGKYFGDATSLHLFAQAVSGNDAPKGANNFDTTALLVDTTTADQQQKTDNVFDSWLKDDIGIQVLDLSDAADRSAFSPKWQHDADTEGILISSKELGGTIGITLPRAEYTQHTEKLYANNQDNTQYVYDTKNRFPRRLVQVATFPYGFTLGIRQLSPAFAENSYRDVYLFGGFPTEWGSKFPGTESGYSYTDSVDPILMVDSAPRDKVRDDINGIGHWSGNGKESYFPEDTSILHSYFGSVGAANYNMGSSSGYSATHAFHIGSHNDAGFFNPSASHGVYGTSSIWVSFYENDGKTPRLFPQVQALWLNMAFAQSQSGLIYGKHFQQTSISGDDGYTFRLQGVSDAPISYNYSDAKLASFAMQGQFFGPGFEGMAAVYTMEVESGASSHFYWGVQGMYMMPKGRSMTIGTPEQRGLLTGG